MQNLWVFSFEYAGIIKVGGLGEVPANQTKFLANQYNITLFIPSHGIHTNMQIVEKLNLTKLNLELCTTLNTQKIGIGDRTESVHIEFLEGRINGIRVVILVGKNEFSSYILNDPIVYAPNTLSGKFVLFSMGIKYYIQQVKQMNPEELPHIIHCHDHHGIPAMMCCRQELRKATTDVATVLTIHLLSWPRYDLEFLKSCGLEEGDFDVFVGGEHKRYTLTEFYMFCKGSDALEPPLEKLGVIFADVVTSVSEDYAMSNVVGYLGGGWVYPKIDFIWNGCDWDYEEMRRNVLSTYKRELQSLDKKNWSSRKNLRKFLLTRAFSYLDESEPIYSSKNVEGYLQNHLTFFPYMKNKKGIFDGKLASFFEDGPLVIATGRISRQKGIDILLDAIPLVLKKHPNAKFIFSVLPTEFSIPDIESFLSRIKLFKNNLRMIIGKVVSLYSLMHIAADIYCVPSRWEPFGITALEGMVSKTILVASQTGGLQEIVLDVSKWGDKGTGSLVHVENVSMLATAISDFISVIKIDEVNQGSLNKEKDRINLLNSIENPEIRNLAQQYADLGTRLRENAHARVEEHFRWEFVTQKLPKIYHQALKNRGITI